MKRANKSAKVHKGMLYAGLGLFLVAAAGMWGPAVVGQGRGGGQGGGRTDAPTRDWSQDMQMKIMEPFTLASVGDMIIIRPASKYADPSFQRAIKLIRDADV